MPLPGFAGSLAATPATEHIRQKLSTLPRGPRIYLMKDRFDTVSYVGKARDLRKRASQYFQSSRRLGWDLKFNALAELTLTVTLDLVAADCKVAVP